MSIHHGDCIEVMAAMPEASVDSIVTDPPYGLEFMGKAWDGANGFRRSLNPADAGRDDVFGRSSRRSPEYRAGRLFMEWCEAWGREALRVTKPGGYLLAFGGTRTHHRLVCGLEDAGWIIRDELDWIYASGFPKGKANLKPAHEPIVLARKPGPLQPLAIDECRIPGQWTTWRRSDGSINPSAGFADEYVGGNDRPDDVRNPENAAGRWPSNVLLSDPELFDEPNPEVVGSGAITASGDAHVLRRGASTGAGMGYGSSAAGDVLDATYGDSGGYSRFFIVPKADRSDREPVLKGQLEQQDVFRGNLPDNPRCLRCKRQRIGALGAAACDCEEPEWAPNRDQQRENAHPTVKPTDLMRHLIRLVTPSGGVVLDPFLGSGSTAIAAELEGFEWIGIDKEAEYIAIAEARLNGTQRGLGLDVPAPTSSYRPPAKMPAVKYEDSGPGKLEWFGNKPEEEA